MWFFKNKNNGILNREFVKKIMGPSVGVLFFTVLSQGTGYFKEVFFTYYLGNSFRLEAYQVADTIPLVFNQIIVNSVPLALTPLFVRDKNNRLCQSALITFLVSMGAVLLIVFSSMNRLVPIIVPKFNEEARVLTGQIGQILIFNVLFLPMIAVMNAFLFSREEFVKPTAALVLLNLIPIITQVITKGNVFCVAVATVSSSVCVCLLLGLLCKKKGLFEKRERLYIKDIKELIRVLIPVFLVYICLSIIIMMDKYFAGMVNGIVIYSCAYKLMYVPVQAIAASFTRVLLPKVTKLAIKREHLKIGRVILFFSLGAIAVTIFAVAAVMLVGHNIVDFVYGHGKYTEEDVLSTATCLKYMIFGVAGISISSFCQSVAYAYKDYKLPLYISFIQIIVYLIVNLGLINIIGVNAVAVSNVISYSLISIIWILVLYRRLLCGYQLKKWFFM